MKPKLLFLSHQVPFPPDKGEKIRAYNILRHLARTHEIHLGCLAPSAAEAAEAEHLRPFTAETRVFVRSRRRRLLHAALHARPGRPLMPDFYHHPGLARWAAATLRDHAIPTAFAYTVVMMPYLRAHAGRTLLDAVDIDSLKWAAYARTARLPARLIWAREGRTLLAAERQAAATAAATFFVSEAEAARFQSLAPDVAGRVTYFENGVDLERFAPGHVLPNPLGAGGPNFVFTGHMDYWPNSDAAAWFATDVLPRLRAQWPDATFWVVGANPSPAVLALTAHPGVRVTGRVPDTRPYLAHATAVVCPLRLARGIQNKVLEGMAMGRPVIATPDAFAGVRAEAGRDLLVADGAEAIAAACAAAARGAHPELGRNARAAMERHYAWSATLARLDPYLK